MNTIHPSPASPCWPAPLSRARKASRAVLCALLFTPTVVALPASSPAQDAATLTTFHTFTGSDGRYPAASLVLGRDGNFYGTTQYGGSNGTGTVFSLTPAGVLTTLHSFDVDDGSEDSVAGGTYPAAALVQGPDGTFYGTTAGTFHLDNGATGYYSKNGTVFSITPAGVFTTLHAFGETQGNYPVNSDGAYPYTPLVLGSDGNLYGTTEYGGSNGYGTVFSITPAGVLTTLHNCGADGLLPLAALVQGNDGKFYGTTSLASNGNGTIFSLTPAGVFTTLYDFTTLGRDGNSDGAVPSAALVQDSDGNFYGTTFRGGANDTGAIFSITPAGVFTTLHSFGPLGDGTNSDGITPVASLVLGSDGNLYGSAQAGGANGTGTVFSLTPAGVFTTLYSFSTTISEGGYPLAALVLGSDGNLYGTNSRGGTGGDGTVLELTLPGATTTPPLPTTTPSVTLTATTPGVSVGSGGDAVFTVALSAAQDHDVVVNFTIKGTAANGTDYTLLKDTKKIKAGHTSKPINIIPQGDLGGAAKKTVVLVLAPGDGYSVGTTGKVKVKITAGQ